MVGQTLLDYASRLFSGAETFSFRPAKVRDLSVIDLDGNTLLVIACDSDGGIGPKELDTVSCSGYVLGRLAARVPLLEMLASGARPILMVNCLAVEMHPSGKEIISGIRKEAAEAGLDPVRGIAGSTEDNVPTRQTGVGVVALGVVSQRALRPGSSQIGDLVYRLGVPKSAPRYRVTPDDPETQIFGLTVESDVAFGLSSFGLPGRQINERVEEVLGFFGLRGLRHSSTAGLSGGEKQRLAIAGVMAMKPDVLVLDEPTDELDPGGKAQFFETLRCLSRERGTSVVMSGHDSSGFVGQASRILVLDTGMLVSDDTPAELFRDVPRCSELGIPAPEISHLLWELRRRGALALENIALGFNGAERLLAELVRRARATGRTKDPPPAPTLPKRTIIEIKDLVHQYSAEVTALRGINLDIFDGEFLVIVGRNGSGKSTLVKHFNSLLRPTSGDVYVQGVNTRLLSSHELSKTVGFLFQNPDHQIFCPTVQTEV